MLSSFGKYLATPASGVTDAAVSVVDLERSVAGELTQVIRSADGVMQSFTQWASSQATGLAGPGERLMQKVRNADAGLLMWTYYPGGALKEFSEWSRETGKLGADAGDLVKVCF